MSKPRRRQFAIWGVVLVAGAVLMAVLVVLLVVFPRMVRSRLEQELVLRELELVDVGRPVLGLGRVTVTDLVVRVRGASDVIVLRMPAADAVLSGTSVVRVDIPVLNVNVQGAPEPILSAIERVQKAQRKLPKSSQHPIDVRTGTLRGALRGGESVGDVSVEFAGLASSIRFEPEDTRVRLERGKLRIGKLEVAPLMTTVKAGRDSQRVVVRAGAEKEASFEWTADGDVQEGTLEVDGLPLAGTVVVGGQGAPQLDFGKATSSGTASFRREGALITSRGDLRLEGVGWTPITVGPVALRPGSRMRLVWIAKGNEAQGLTFDGSRLELSLGGVPRTARISGKCSSLTDDPTLDVRWEMGPIPCAEVAQDVAASSGAGILSGLAGSLVRGSLLARGVLKGPLGDTASLKHDIQVLQGCTVELPSLFR